MRLLRHYDRKATVDSDRHSGKILSAGHISSSDIMQVAFRASGQFVTAIDKEVATHPSCSSPTCFSSFEKHDALSLGSLILAEVSRSRCACYATSYDNNVSFGGKLFGCTVSKQKFVRLAVPERVARLRRWESCPFVLHVARAIDSCEVDGCGVGGEGCSRA